MESLHSASVALVLATSSAPAAMQPALPDAAERQITVASYNIHHAAGADGVLDLERIANVLDDTGAEVIGLQEVDNHWGSRSDFVDQAGWLADRLGMHACYSANLDLDPLPGQVDRRQYGTAILSAYKLGGCTNTPLPNHTGGEQRGLAQADVKVRGVDFRFYNTHLTHNNKDERLAQAKAMNALVQGDGVPSILVGDLNAAPDAVEYDEFTAELVDLWPVVGEGPGFTIDAQEPNRRIDYVLASDDITPRSAHVPQTLASDHLPVVVDLTLPHPSQVNGRGNG